MDIKLAFFYVFSAILVVAAIRVITARNPVHSALFLVLAFFQAAMIWMLLKAEFLAITLVLVYVGAVMVLFLFVVMMLDVNFDKLREGFARYLPIGGFIGVVMVLEMAAILMKNFSVPASAAIGLKGENNTKELGKLLYSDYVFHVQIAAVILFVALIAAVALTLRKRKDVRYNDPSAAVKVKSTDRLRIIKMPSSKPAEAAVSTPGVKQEPAK
jgi:NADH-quinone oxidoreductase subunit J